MHGSLALHGTGVRSPPPSNLTLPRSPYEFELRSPGAKRCGYTFECCHRKCQKTYGNTKFSLPENWTYSKIVEQVIHWGSGGSTLYEIFSDITEYGFASNDFHEALKILYSIGGRRGLVDKDGLNKSWYPAFQSFSSSWKSFYSSRECGQEQQEAVPPED